MRGWTEDLSSVRNLSELPAAAQAYVGRIEREVGCPMMLVSVGSRRDETIVLRDPFAG
jgi:adenylosuccinate synthase